MKMIGSISVAVLLGLLSIAPKSVAAETPLRLQFPKIFLDNKKHETIEEIHLQVTCGHIKGIRNIPDDWNVEIIRAVATVEALHASAGHGGSRLDGIGSFNGSVEIVPESTDCFGVTGTILISGFPPNGVPANKEVSISSAQFRYKP